MDGLARSRARPSATGCPLRHQTLPHTAGTWATAWRSSLTPFCVSVTRAVGKWSPAPLNPTVQLTSVDMQPLVFPNETHENLTYAHLMRQYEATADFLGAHLGAAK